jgi:hypothetical protein
LSKAKRIRLFGGAYFPDNPTSSSSKILASIDFSTGTTVGGTWQHDMYWDNEEEPENLVLYKKKSHEIQEHMFIATLSSHN